MNNVLVLDEELPGISEDVLYQIVKDFCAANRCYESRSRINNHLHITIWGKPERNKPAEFLDPPVGTVTFYGPTSRVNVFLNDLESLPNLPEHTLEFLYDLPLSPKTYILDLSWSILAKTKGRGLADAWRAKFQGPAIGPAEPRKPQKPAMPKKISVGGTTTEWFDWYHAMLESGYKCTLEDIARENGYSPVYIRYLHMLYKRERYLT